jgi:hypothetical protein
VFKRRVKFVLLTALMLAAAPAPIGVSGEAKVYPVIAASGGYLLGGVSDRKNWMTPAAVAGSLTGAEEYHLYTLAGKVGASTATKPRKDPDGICGYVLTMKSPPAGQGDLIGIASDWDPLPRPPKIFAGPTLSQQDAVSYFLRAHSLSNFKINITQTIKADLDNDGLEETILSATTPEAVNGLHQGPMVYYSVVVIRKIGAGEIKTILLDGTITGPVSSNYGLNRYWISAVLDVNGDGREEVIVSSSNNAGHATAVFELKGDEVKKVMQSGCGKN